MRRSGLPQKRDQRAFRRADGSAWEWSSVLLKGVGVLGGLRIGASLGLTDGRVGKARVCALVSVGESACRSDKSDLTTYSDRVFVVAGYTDSVGHEDYNYELGQRRATSVAGYLVGKKGLDPTQVRVVSYGAGKPVADNSTPDGRRRNRRVEILVYQERIATGS